MGHKINVLFPMAGDGVRFGGTQFKPFLDATEYLFIELAKQPFDPYTKSFDIEYYFVYRQDQETQYQVSQRLHKLFSRDTIHACILDSPTSGPLETTARAIQQYNLQGSFFICDCDHSIQVQPMFQMLEKDTNTELLVPIWPISYEQQKDFGKVLLDQNGRAVRFVEKEQVPLSADYDIFGLLGCYYFKDITALQWCRTANFSDILPTLTQTLATKYVRIQSAGFFGTPESLTLYRYQLARKMTFFVDIDGTLFYLPKHVSYDAKDIQLLPGALNKLQEWKDQGHTIVLTTGRTHARRERLLKVLAELKIPYDQLVTNLRPGPRILINDKKPYSEIHAMAKAIQVKRNVGIADIHLEETPDIVETLKGGSFASVYLIHKDNEKRVRKYIYKTAKHIVHYETLRRQYDDLCRFSYYSPGITPKLLGCYESENDFFYDMEYLENYKELSHYPRRIQEQVVKEVFQRLSTDIYCFQKKVDGHSWYKEYRAEKILPKYSFIESLGVLHATILNAASLQINGEIIPGLRAAFDTDIAAELLPEYVSPIHGDLTLENILFNEELHDFKLIDTSGARYVDVKEMDFAKCLQSLVAKYENWDTYVKTMKIVGTTQFEVDTEVLNTSYEAVKCIFQDYPHPSVLYKRALFFLGTYLLRMTPFLEKKSNQHSLFGLLLAAYYIQASTI